MFIRQFRGSDVVHGPCLSNKDGVANLALTLHYFTSLLGHEQFDLVIHCLANDIHFLECNVNAKTHTQLPCYALMKILIKDIVNRDSRCKDLLCSFYIKNIIFWVSEERS
jgi:hypothetical protein